MSFGDIGGWGAASTPAPVPSSADEIANISGLLQNLQRECQVTKDNIATMRRRKIGPSEKNELVMKIKEIKDAESTLKLKMDAEYQRIDALPRPEAAPKRTTLGKLMKDFDKVKVNIQAILNEAALVKVVNERGEVESFARTSSMANSTATTGRAGSGVESWGAGRGGVNSGSGRSAADPEYRGNTPPPPPKTKEELQQLKLQPLLQGKEVDDAILEERERDIKKMNHDLILVNEMFKDMAELVDKQGGKIDDIHTAADKAHDRAKAGLQQVNQAAEYQPGCVLC